jgi:hypothetical protein
MHPLWWMPQERLPVPTLCIGAFGASGAAHLIG